MKNGLLHILKPCTAAWLSLLALAAISFQLAYDKPGRLLMVFVLVLTLLKGQLVVDYFMGLRHAGPVWRATMGAYLIAVGTLIGIAYLIS